MYLAKFRKALELVNEHTKPGAVILSSFGKDSMVLLQLFKELGLRLPIIFFRESHSPAKYIFANKVILANKYIVYDYPPTESGWIEANGEVEVLNFYSRNYDSSQFIYLPTGIREPSSEEYLCGLYDLYYKPKGTFNFPWDTLFIGHKASDVDPILGNAPPRDYIVPNDHGKVIYPLLDFTDEDIWEMHKLFHIPIHDTRYNPDNNFKEFEDKTLNPDYFEACTKCMKSSKPVFCEKFNREVPSARVDLKIITPDQIGRG